MILLRCNIYLQQRHSKWYILIISLVIPIIGSLACTLPRAGVTNSSQSVRASCNCEGGAYPSELTINYRAHYLAMVIDSYIVNQQLELVQERLKTFSERDKIKALGERSVRYAINEQTEEAQLVNELAVTLNQVENWNSETIMAVVAELVVSSQYQGNDIKKQALNDFSFQLIGMIPVQ